MVKRLFRRLKERRLKRTTFWKMFLKAMIIPVIVMIILGKNVPIWIIYSAISNSSRINDSISDGLEKKILAGDSGKFPYPFYMCVNGSLDIQPVGGYIDPRTWVQPDGYSIVFTFDSNGEIIHSNRAKMFVFVSYGGELPPKYWDNYGPPYNQLYVYDPLDNEFPELTKLFSDQFEAEKNNCNLSFRLKSIYVNQAENKMIPHEMTVFKSKFEYGFLEYGFTDDEQIYALDEQKLEHYDIKVDTDADGYELIELYDEETGKYPRQSITGIYGIAPEVFDSTVAEYREKYSEYFNPDRKQCVFEADDPYLKSSAIGRIRKFENGNEDNIFGYFSMVYTDMRGPDKWKRCIFWLGILYGIMTLAVILSCWSRNVKNKAHYAFEDYQRALTNNLAHDLKTPLAVIGGYAENLMEMRKDSGSEKELNYLKGILNNVSNTDNIISRSLSLSQAEQLKPNKEKVDINEIVKSTTEKYKDRIHERGLGISSDAEGVWNTDRDALTMIVDNLISNAVKYTGSKGGIRVTADSKRLSISNDVDEKLDTGELKMPFVKGEKSRSDKKSSGLGLSIADSAARQCGMKLELSCTDKEFTAVLKQ